MRRLQGRGKTEKEAEELVDSFERERVDFIQKHFNIEGPDAIYHTMMNTAIGDEAIVDMFLSSSELTRQEVRHDNSSGNSVVNFVGVSRIAQITGL